MEIPSAPTGKGRQEMSINKYRTLSLHAIVSSSISHEKK